MSFSLLCSVSVVLQVADFWELGVTPIAVSALSGTGTGELLDALVASLPRPISNEEEDMEFPPLAIAIVGRPNVGEWGGQCFQVLVWRRKRLFEFDLFRLFPHTYIHLHVEIVTSKPHPGM